MVLRDVGAQSKRLIAAVEPGQYRPADIQTQATAIQGERFELAGFAAHARIWRGKIYEELSAPRCWSPSGCFQVCAARARLATLVPPAASLRCRDVPETKFEKVVDTRGQLR